MLAACSCCLVIDGLKLVCTSHQKKIKFYVFVHIFNTNREWIRVGRDFLSATGISRDLLNKHGNKIIKNSTNMNNDSETDLKLKLDSKTNSIKDNAKIQIYSIKKLKHCNA